MLGIGLVLRSVRRLTALVLVSVAAALVQPLPAGAQAQEFRAFWVDAFHAGFKNSAQVTTLIATVREANCNAVVVEIRKRGDAYYTPDTGYADYEPHATDTDPANFDSLADLVGKAHDTSGGKARVEVHAWLVTWPIWGSTTAPSNPQHPYNRHPEWLTQNTSGTTWNGNQYCFDPGHPGAFEHTFRIAISLVTNYDLDGINFDYVRYAGNTWGYNPTAVSRFHARYGGSGNPLSTDPNWLQFRRDQVTAFVRKVYLNTIARKPNVKVSADTITWAPGPANLSAWYASARAYHDVLQDWRAWMQEGILDLNIPMAYFNQAGSYTQDWTNWCDFIRDNQYGRHAVIGPGLYLNGTADAIRQMRYARTPSPSGNSVRGVCGYSYAVPDADSIPFGTFLQYLTSTPNAYDSVTPALFAQPASIPAMPWKTSPATGHLMGTVFSGAFGNAADGAV
ncbi:MAG TPA: family 10 glycosylhydrolase, partial [Verrucomicrobiae bacterium]